MALSASCSRQKHWQTSPPRCWAHPARGCGSSFPADVLGSGNDARFAALLTAADKLGIQYIATGHHARVELGSDGVHTVCPAVDAALDESAALAALPQDTLARLLLPLGEFTAADVQEMAQDFKVNGTV